MTTPDLTPDRADEIRQRRPASRGLVALLACVGAYSTLVVYAARILQHRFNTPPLATACIGIGFAYILLALTKPALYWDSESAVQARMKSSAKQVTVLSLVFGGALIVIGILGIVL